MRISGLIAPCFRSLAWYSMQSDGSYVDYWLKGGRGSGKSSVVSLLMLSGLMRDPQANAIIFRKVGDTLRTSVYEKIKWAANKLGVSEYFRFGTNPMEVTYIHTGQKILFRGLDDHSKLKSIDQAKGYFRYAWFEELAEFKNMEEVTQAMLSIRRGGSSYSYFYTYNPPKRLNNWVNLEAATPKKGRLVINSSYLDVPAEWLGDAFMAEAEHLKNVNPQEYRHVFLGEATGTGGTVFPNVQTMKMTDDQIRRFDKVRCGIDWGYAADPFAFVQCHYDKTRRRLFIFDEIYRLNLLNNDAMPLIKEHLGKDYRRQRIVADSEEPKSVSEFRYNGLNVSGAKKGKGSVEYGIKWLQSLEAIYIDPLKAPNCWREFSSYELEQDRLGAFKSGMPDRDNHTIDAVRYACEDDMRQGSVYAKNYD
ncbi:MAG: PBSX family phage terminase large subunit [Elusimicrobiales bacterium]|nr:PBSX family phage terminase large subunit [Elusimicrobiales bacterium]